MYVCTSRQNEHHQKLKRHRGKHRAKTARPAVAQCGRQTCMWGGGVSRGDRWRGSLSRPLVFTVSSEGGQGQAFACLTGTGGCSRGCGLLKGGARLSFPRQIQGGARGKGSRRVHPPRRGPHLSGRGENTRNVSHHSPGATAGQIRRSPTCRRTKKPNSPEEN